MTRENTSGRRVGRILYDVAIGGIAGMATAARLQARRLATIAFRAHSQPGGCVFFRHQGFVRK